MKKSSILFAVIGTEFKEDFGKGIEVERKGRCGLLSWHEDIREAFIACSKINLSGGFASVKKTNRGEMSDEMIEGILEAII